MEEHILKVKAIYWKKNGQKRYDIWQEKEIDDKDRIDIQDTIKYYLDVNGHSNFKEVLANKILELNLKMKGLTHIEVWEKGQLIKIFRVIKCGSNFKNWDEVIKSVRGVL